MRKTTKRFYGGEFLSFNPIGSFFFKEVSPLNAITNASTNSKFIG